MKSRKDSSLFTAALKSVPKIMVYSGHKKCISIFSYTSGRPFKWFPEEVSGARRAADQDKKQKTTR